MHACTCSSVRATTTRRKLRSGRALKRLGRRARRGARHKRHGHSKGRGRLAWRGCSGPRGRAAHIPSSAESCPSSEGIVPLSELPPRYLQQRRGAASGTRARTRPHSRARSRTPAPTSCARDTPASHTDPSSLQRPYPHAAAPAQAKLQPRVHVRAALPVHVAVYVPTHARV